MFYLLIRMPNISRPQSNKTDHKFHQSHFLGLFFNAIMHCYAISLIAMSNNMTEANEPFKSPNIPHRPELLYLTGSLHNFHKK